MVGLGGLEPPTSRLSGVRSNQLSYRPTARSRGGDRAVGTWRPAALSPGAQRTEPGRARRDESSPTGKPTELASQPKLQKERRIAHGPENPEDDLG